MNLPTSRFMRRCTQWELAKHTKISQSRISLFERGFVNLSQDEKRRIAEVLHVSIDEVTPWMEAESNDAKQNPTTQ